VALEPGDAPATACRVRDPELQLSYTGGCRDGLAQGQGVARGAGGAWYRGGFEAGRKSGAGVKLYPNGDGYAGEWANDRRNGQGRYEYGPRSPWRGDVYQGGWRDDQREGRGTYIFFPSGDRYTAWWHQGRTDELASPTLIRRQRAVAALAPVLGRPGVAVCSVTTQGAAPDRLARGVVVAVRDDRIQVRIEAPEVLRHSPDPRLNPRWEVMTDWRACP
jgi:hypothetical protein